MEIRHLRYFVAVAEECHFGRAAERLHIAQSPLSQQIKQLEAEIGVALLRRSTRRVEITAAGARFLERARAVLAMVEDASAEAVRVAAGEIGRVTIGFTGSATYELLPTLSRALRAGLPGVQIDLRGELLTPAQASGLIEGELDVGLLRPPIGDADLDVTLLRSEPLIAVLPESHPLATAPHVDVADLRDEHFVGYPAQHRSVVHDTVVDACRAAGFDPQSTEVAETSTLVSFVAAGLGVALVPRSVQHLRITGATYRPLSGVVPTVDLALASRRGDQSPAVSRVIEVIRRQLQTPHVSIET